VPDVATQAYYTWDNAGRPWRLAKPIAELAELAREHPEITLVGTIGDESHLTDATPEDHTPFSIDEWPVEIGAYVVCAIDFGGPAEAIGAMCQKALREKPGFLKYLIWRGPVGKTGLRDVRRNWAYQEGSGHTSHAHWSIRTDWIDRSIGDYQLTEDDMEPRDLTVYDPGDPRYGVRNQPFQPDYATNKTVQPRWAWERAWAHSHGADDKLAKRVIPMLEALVASHTGSSLEQVQAMMRAELDAAAERERTERQAELAGLGERLAATVTERFGADVGQVIADEFLAAVHQGTAPDQPAGTT
jgi:hypothetical protein